MKIKWDGDSFRCFISTRSPKKDRRNINYKKASFV